MFELNAMRQSRLGDCHLQQGLQYIHEPLKVLKPAAKASISCLLSSWTFPGPLPFLFNVFAICTFHALQLLLCCSQQALESSFVAVPGLLPKPNNSRVFSMDQCGGHNRILDTSCIH